MRKRLMLARDVLDQQVIDADGERMGRIDGIVLTIAKGKPPRFTAIEIGTGTLFRRVSSRLGDFLENLERRLGVGDGNPFRIPVEKIQRGGLEIKLDLKVGDTPVERWEDWVRRKLIDHIPGARRK